jgi:hypothetical protein
LFQLKQFKDQESNSDLFREETESQQRALAAQDTQRRQVILQSQQPPAVLYVDFAGCAWFTSR